MYPFGYSSQVGVLGGLLADNQRDSLRKMEADQRLGEWLGEDFVRIYGAAKWFDVRLFDKQITALEYELLLPYL